MAIYCRNGNFIWTKKYQQKLKLYYIQNKYWKQKQRLYAHTKYNTNLYNIGNLHKRVIYIELDFALGHQNTTPTVSSKRLNALIWLLKLCYSHVELIEPTQPVHNVRTTLYGRWNDFITLKRRLNKVILTSCAISEEPFDCKVSSLLTELADHKKIILKIKNTI